eukprot:RCo021493
MPPVALPLNCIPVFVFFCSAFLLSFSVLFRFVILRPFPVVTFAHPTLPFPEYSVRQRALKGGACANAFAVMCAGLRLCPRQNSRGGFLVEVSPSPPFKAVFFLSFFLSSM